MSLLHFPDTQELYFSARRPDFPPVAPAPLCSTRKNVDQAPTCAEFDVPNPTQTKERSHRKHACLVRGRNRPRRQPVIDLLACGARHTNGTVRRKNRLVEHLSRRMHLRRESVFRCRRRSFCFTPKFQAVLQELRGNCPGGQDFGNVLQPQLPEVHPLPRRQAFKRPVELSQAESFPQADLTRLHTDVSLPRRDRSRPPALLRCPSPIGSKSRSQTGRG